MRPLARGYEKPVEGAVVEQRFRDERRPVEAEAANCVERELDGDGVVEEVERDVVIDEVQGGVLKGDAAGGAGGGGDSREKSTRFLAHGIGGLVG